METVVRKSIEELNEILPKEKKLALDGSTPLIDEKSNCLFRLNWKVLLNKYLVLHKIVMVLYLYIQII